MTAAAKTITAVEVAAAQAAAARPGLRGGRPDLISRARGSGGPGFSNNSQGPKSPSF